MTNADQLIRGYELVYYQPAAKRLVLIQEFKPEERESAIGTLAWWTKYRPNYQTKLRTVISVEGAL